MTKRAFVAAESRSRRPCSGQRGKRAATRSRAADRAGGWSTLISLSPTLSQGRGRTSMAFCQGRGGIRPEAALAHERLDDGVAPAEGAIALGRIDGVACGEDVLAQPLGDFLVVRPVRLGERLER